MNFDPEYPFSAADCDHNKFYTDPDNIGFCKLCISMNMALSDDQESDDELVEDTYTIMGTIAALSRALENDE